MIRRFPPPWTVEELGALPLISRLSDSPPCPAQWARVRRMRVMVRWARGVAAAAVAIMRLESERQYERRAGSAAVAITQQERRTGSAAVVPASPLARAQGPAQRSTARTIEGT